MLTATFKIDPNALRALSEQFNKMVELSRSVPNSAMLEFIPGYPECAVTGEDNSVMRFIGHVAQFGSSGLTGVQVPAPAPVRDHEGILVIPRKNIELEPDPHNPGQLHARLLVPAFAGESWPMEIVYKDNQYSWERRAITPDGYYGAAFYILK